MGKDVLDDGEESFRRRDFFAEEPEKDARAGLSSPTWRGLVIAVAAATILSVAATFLLGGSSVYGRTGSAGGCGEGGACCAPVSGR